MAATIEELRAMFAELDRDGTGTITADEFKKAMHALGGVLDPEAINKMMASVDDNHDGCVSFDEFCNVMSDSKSAIITRSEVNKFFQAFDVDCSGYITTAEFRHMMTTLGHNMDDDSMDAMMGFLDTDGNGQCGLKEFVDLLAQLGLQVVEDEEEEEEFKDIKLSAPPVVDAPHQPVVFGSDELRSLLAPVTAADGTINAADLSRALELLAKERSLSSHDPAANMSLHWDPLREIRGLGEVLYKVNHIAIIVSDVGRSAAFYSDVIGLQQIRRPDFDRHGAWFTMGNVELHLIKGNPVVPSGDDLIVGHIALETYNIDRVPEILKAKGIHFRQNVSVPKGMMAQGKGTNDSNNSSNIVKQYFIRDPDGYYLEVCNCDVLTDYCLGKKEDLAGYGEDVKPLSMREASLVQLIGLQLSKKGCSRALRIKRLMDEYAGRPVEEIAAALGASQTAEVDEAKLQSLVTRRTVYGDICQSMTEEELKTVLLYADNNIEQAIDIITIHVGDDQNFSPPAFFEDGKEKFKPKTFRKSKGGIGHCSTDKNEQETLHARQPVRHVDELSAPLVAKPQSKTARSLQADQTRHLDMQTNLVTPSKPPASVASVTDRAPARSTCVYVHPSLRAPTQTIVGSRSVLLHAAPTLLGSLHSKAPVVSKLRQSYLQPPGSTQIASQAFVTPIGSQPHCMTAGYRSLGVQRGS